MVRVIFCTAGKESVMNPGVEKVPATITLLLLGQEPLRRGVLGRLIRSCVNYPLTESGARQIKRLNFRWVWPGSVPAHTRLALHWQLAIVEAQQPKDFVLTWELNPGIRSQVPSRLRELCADPVIAKLLSSENFGDEAIDAMLMGARREVDLLVNCAADGYFHGALGLEDAYAEFTFHARGGDPASALMAAVLAYKNRDRRKGGIGPALVDQAAE